MNALQRPTIFALAFRLTLLLALLLAAAPFATAAEHAPDPGEPAEAPHHEFHVADFEKAGVAVATAAAGEVDLGVELPGEVRPDADRIAHLAPRFAGIAREVRAGLGDHVRAGDVLAVVESANLADFAITAAFDGTVIGKHIAPGETVDPGEAAFILADLRTVWVHVSIYQSALDDVAVGQEVVVRANRGSLEARGKIDYIAPVVDQSTRTATARVPIANENGAWRPGLFVDAVILGPVAAPVVIDRDAIQAHEGRRVVFVVDGDRFAMREVTVGRVGRTRAEITQGLAAGERFASGRSFLVKAELTRGEGGEDHEH